MSDKTPLVVVFPRGQLTPKDKERMSKAGVIAVEADTPEAVCQLHLSAPLVSTQISGDAIVTCALKAMRAYEAASSGGSITGAGQVKARFVDLLADALTQPKKATA